MEKLIYVLRETAVPSAKRLSVWSPSLREAADEAGAHCAAFLVPDETPVIRERSPARLSPNFDETGMLVSVWLDSLDTRAPLEAALRAIDPGFWAYLVTESTFGPAPVPEHDGRIPGITQISLNDKPAGVSDEDFYREWQEVHSKLSFELHPTRVSYERNAVARRLNSGSPSFRAIVLERFPSLEDFVDESIYFGDPQVVQKMFAHVPSFYRFDTAITGAMSEYRFSGSRAD